ncbi:MAG: hypothetical protein JWM78_1157 [Verrucomicrobiaceae bacterium]|nr:hypothetical protein [Verrucomicrobiaceae bacterium]
MAHLTARVACALIVCSAALQVCADSYDNAEKNNDVKNSDVEFGFDVGIDRAHQEFESSSADLTTVTLAPRAMFGNWELSLNLPWQHAEGGYFVNSNFPPQLQYTCARVAALTSLILQRHPKLAALNQGCQNAGVSGTTLDNSVSGIGDATVFLRYALPLDADGIWLLSVGGGYKFDNGDADKNLGSGTRNAMLEASLGASYGWFIGSITGGYAAVDETDATNTKSNYSYGSVDAGIRPLDWLTLGANWSSDESYYDGAETVQKTTAYARVKPFEHFSFKVYTSDYGNTEGYPEREYGASIYLTY